MIEQGRLREALSYDELTGEFTWIKPSKYHAEKCGRKAGTTRTAKGKSYVWIKIDGVATPAHRLAWLYVYGVEPTVIDHINGRSTDNRIVNLREATSTQNAQNHTKRVGPSGLPTGVRINRSSGRYVARITANKRLYCLGTFDTPQEARKAYVNARKEMHDAPAIQ